MTATTQPPKLDQGNEEPRKPTSRRRVRREGQSRLARGESQLWLCGGALTLCILMISGLLALIVARGMVTFWPAPLVSYQLIDGTACMGEVEREEEYTPPAAELSALSAEVAAVAQATLQASDGLSRRTLVRTGNFDLTGNHFRWVPEYLVESVSTPEDALQIERESWGRFHGRVVGYRRSGEVVTTDPAEGMALLRENHPAVHERHDQALDLRNHAIKRLTVQQHESRLAVRAAELAHGPDSRQVVEARSAYETVSAATNEKLQELTERIRELEGENAQEVVLLQAVDGKTLELPLASIVRFHTTNSLNWFERVGVYLSRWWEFLTAEPRESNSEGGVFPAIFGTVLMTLLMTICVVPFGVLAALYLREYARAGLLISAVRIAVNNLAGVPSIVFGVFGLGFFCYTVGGSIDDWFYPERLPSPTFGKGGLLWASLTLALLTLPVVIVSTEEALAAVPSSMREGSYACGASKWQTIRRIVLPRAMPGIMTGAILAMARGAGEVAPLMLVGAVKLAPELPMDTEGTILHPSRSFMHLGFHIFDLGFQSQNSEGNKPVVFTTTLLLIGIILLLNVVAIRLRTRLRRRFVGAQF
jgi:phosphate transport system permease protein